METTENHGSIGGQRLVGFERAKSLYKGCIVSMKASSKCRGHENLQCVSYFCEPLDEVGLYGHNRHFRTWDIENVVEYPIIEISGS